MSTPGILAALAAALSWAVASVAISRVLSHGNVTPAAANLFKNGLAASCFFLAALVLGGRWPVGDAWGWLFLSGVLGFAVSDTLYFAAFQRCGVQTSATVLLLNVPIATLLAVPLAGDSIRMQVLPFMGVVLVGVLLVILGSRMTRSGDRASASGVDGSTGSYAVGIGLALCAAFAIGTAVPLGRGRFDDVGVWPGAFIRLLGGAMGGIPLAALSGYRRGTTPGQEVGRLLQPVFTAPGPGSVWGRLPLFGVGCAILGLVPYHYALRELPGGLSALLFASTPLFTLPLALLLGQRVGWLAVIGTLTGFAGVGGILLRTDDVPLPRSTPPVVRELEFASPEGTRLPTFVVGGASDAARAEAGRVARPVLAVAAHADDIDRFRLSLFGSVGGAVAAQRDVIEEPLVLGDETDDGSAIGPGSVAARGRFFVNWADVPKAARLATGGGLVTAHLERIGDATYAYGIRLTLEEDGPPGRDLGWLHEDRAPVEHGFVSVVPGLDGGAGFVWLDGRATGSEGGAMQLMARTLRADGVLLPEVTLDDRVCDCCPTDAAVMADGSIVIVYRDRSVDEVRDIACVRLSPDGRRLGDPTLVHADGWQIDGCPVNGPSVAVHGDVVAVAWFTQDGATVDGASGDPEVRVAFSTDGARSFGDPQIVASGGTLGRVAIAAFIGPRSPVGAGDAVDAGDARFAVAHLALVESESGAGLATWVVATVGPGSSPSAPAAIAEVDAARRSGGLDLAPVRDAADGPATGPESDPAIDAVWAGSQGIEAARITLPRTLDVPE